MKNHSVQEGIFFLFAGAALLVYAVTSYGKAFNKDWSQSPYLFPLMVAVSFMFLAACLIREGAREQKEGARSGNLDKAGAREVRNWRGVAAVLAMCALYYGALFFVKMPYITVGILTFSFTFSTFEAATWIFLVAMMVYMGVRKPLILGLVPLGAALFLSIAFRAMLNVLLP